MWILEINRYERVRRRLNKGDKAVFAASEQLRASAEVLCERHAPAVTDKVPTSNSPSTDPHDYVSIGTYWWPNPDTADGIPYVCHDGEFGPDFFIYDRPRWDEAVDGMIQATRAAYFLQDARYANEAVRRIRRWFIDPDTRMNPHLCFSQMIPGRCTGNSVGIIDFALYMPSLLDHVRLLATLQNSPWTENDQHLLQTWCGEMLSWLKTHRLGREEEAAHNNHGTYFDLFAITLALFIEQTEHAQSQLDMTRQRILTQIEPDGRMPHELGRSCSFAYSMMDTLGFVDLALIGKKLGSDLWGWSSEDGKCIQAAVDYLYRFACSSEEWPFPQIEPIDWRMVSSLFIKVNSLSDDAYPTEKMVHRLPAGFDAESFVMIQPLHPFGHERSPAGLSSHANR